MTEAASLEAFLLRGVFSRMNGAVAPSVLVTAIPAFSRIPPGMLRAAQVFVAERDGRVIGLTGWTHEAPQGGAAGRGLAYLRFLCVAHDTAGQGVGRSLVDHVVDQARTRGMTRMKAPMPGPIVEFLAHVGFARGGTGSVQLPGGFALQVTEMQKTL